MPRAERRLGYPIREGRKGDRRLRAAMTMMNAIVNIHRGESSVPFVFLRVDMPTFRRWPGGRGAAVALRWPGTSSACPACLMCEVCMLIPVCAQFHYA